MTTEACWRHLLVLQDRSSDDVSNRWVLNVPGVADPLRVAHALQNVLAHWPAVSAIDFRPEAFRSMTPATKGYLRKFIGLLYDTKFGCELRLIYYTVFPCVDQLLTAAFAECTRPDKLAVLLQLIGVTMVYPYLQPITKLLVDLASQGAGDGDVAFAQVAAATLVDSLVSIADFELPDVLALPRDHVPRIPIDLLNEDGAPVPIPEFDTAQQALRTIRLQPDVIVMVARAFRVIQPSHGMLRYLHGLVVDCKGDAVTDLLNHFGVLLGCNSPDCCLQREAKASSLACLHVPVQALSRMMDAVVVNMDGVTVGNFWMCMTLPSQWKTVSEKIVSHSSAGLPPSKLLPIIRRAVRDTHAACSTGVAEGGTVSLGGRVFDAVPTAVLRDIQSLKPNYCQSEFMETAIRHQIRNRRPVIAAVLAGSDPHLQRFAFGLLRRTFPKENWSARLQWSMLDGLDESSDEVILFQPELFLSGEGALPVADGISVMSVVDVAGLQHMASHLTSASVVGLDAEWRPRTAYSPVKQWPVSILQIALPTVVFIVDLLALHTLPLYIAAEVTSAIDSSIGELLRGPCIKAGYGIANDLKLLAGTHPSWFSSLSTCNNVLELTALAQSCMDCTLITSLSALTQATLRVKLDKAKQTSDWQLRPLVVEQLRYAACDALVLLHVYSALVSRGATSTPFLQSLTLSQDGSHVVDVENGAHYRPETAPVPSAPVVPAHGAPPTPDELALHLGTKHVMEYLASFGLQDRVVFLEPSPTAAIAAANLGIATKQIVNSLAFIVDGKAIIVLASGRSRVCMNKLSAVFGCPKKKVKMASRAQCLEIFGYLPGSFPPCAHRQPVPVYLDALVVDIGAEGELFFGAGDFESMVQLTSDEVKLVARAAVIDVTNPVDAPEPTMSAPQPPCGAAGTGFPPISHAVLDDWSLDKKPKFIVDVMLGRLAKWLRLVGYDTLAVTSTDSRRMTEMITASERDQRVILTKDVRLLAKAGHAVAYLVGQGPVEEQFAEVKAHFQLTCDIAHAFSRCARCNCNTFTSATSEEIAASDEVPPKVRSHILKNRRLFFVCDDCKKTYWEEIPGVVFGEPR